MEKQKALAFQACLKAARMPVPIQEHRFHPVRRWRFDFAWERYRVALEVEGAVWTQGRHTRGAGFLKDMEKYNEAARLGWIVLRTTPQLLHKPSTEGLIRDVLLGRGWIPQ